MMDVICSTLVHHLTRKFGFNTKTKRSIVKPNTGTLDSRKYSRERSNGRRRTGRNKDGTDRSRDLAAELFHAVDDNDTRKLKELIRIGADVNEYYQSLGNITSGKSILHICCEKGRLKCARILIDGGADIFITDKWQMTPLMYSIITQCPDVASFLLSRNPLTADVQAKHGKSALHCAIETGKTEMVDVLIKFGADVNIRNDFGMTPLLLLCSMTDINSHALPMLDLLVEAGADINTTDNRSCQSALQFAVRRKNLAVSEKLLKLGADPDSTDRSHRTPLTNLMYENLQRRGDVTEDIISIASSLIKAGADLNRTDHVNCNPLVTAVAFKSIQLIKLFLKFGAKPNIIVGNKMTPLMMAVLKNHVDAAVTLANVGCLWPMDDNQTDSQITCDPLLLAIEHSQWEMAAVLALAGFDLVKYPFIREADHDQGTPESLRDNIEMLYYLKELATTPRTLFHCTVLRIWQILEHNIDNKLLRLPLPNALKENISPEQFLTSHLKL